MPPHWVKVQIRAHSELHVGRLYANVQALDLDLGVLLTEHRSGQEWIWTGAVQIPQPVRFYRIQLLCEDVSATQVCFEAVRFPDELTSSTVSVRLVGRPNGVWGQLDSPAGEPPLSLQFGWGLAVLAAAGVLLLRRLRLG